MTFPLEPTNPTGKRMSRFVPPMWYGRSRTALGIFEAQGELLDQFREDLQAVSDARLPQTAARWGLDRLRVEVGLPEIAGESDDALRSRIIARFRGGGSTIFQLRQVALSWQYGDVHIIPDPEAYNLWIEFSDPRGRPLDFESHEAEMRANVAAHIGINYIFSLLIWDELRRAGVTWQQLLDNGITWEHLRTMTYQQLVALP